MTDLATATAFLKHVRYPGCSPHEQEEYIQAHVTRIFETFRVIEKLHLSADQVVVDIGAKPYMLAALVKKYSPAQFVGIGYSIEDVRDVQHADASRKQAGSTGAVQVKTAQIPLTAQHEEFPITMWQCNVETDQLPLTDKSVDVVVFSEILEHLLFNPALVIAEMNRILKPGGIAIVSTPNQLYWVRLMKLLLGTNIDDPYSIHGPYGRRNRNYTPREIKQLYRAQGFKCTGWTSESFLPLQTSSRQRFLVKTGHLLFTLIPNRRGKTFFGTFKKKEHKPDPAYPAWLYH